MAIDVSGTQTAVAAAVLTKLKEDLSTAYGEDESVYEEYSTILADAIALAVAAALDEVKDNADVTGVTTGISTVAGGVD